MIFSNGIIASQVNKYLLSGLGSVGEYNSNNSWYFNGNNRNLNNNNRYNSNFRSRPCSDYIDKSKESVNHNPIPLEEIVEIEEEHKSSKPNCVNFRINKIHNLIDVWHKLNNNEVNITEAFVFTAKLPKIREIVYCNYNDKLIQSFYVFSLRNYLENNWFDMDSYSCINGRGVLKAVNKYREYIRIVSNNYTEQNVYLASIDIKGFFTNIDTNLLAEKMKVFIENNLENHPYKDKLLYLTNCLYVIDWHKVKITRMEKEGNLQVPKEKSLFYKDPYIGVPIGNWPSQVGGNFLTSFALTFIRGLGYNYFVHYTDDTSFVITNKNKFLKDIKIIEKYYKEVLHLELHKNKRYLQHYSKGITVLGRRIKYNKCIPSKMTFKTINKLINNIINCRNLKYNLESVSQSLNSYMGMLVHMTTYNYRKKIMEKLYNSVEKYFDIYETKQQILSFEPHITEIQFNANYNMKIELLRIKNIKDYTIKINNQCVKNTFSIYLARNNKFNVKIVQIHRNKKSNMTFNSIKFEYSKILVKKEHKIKNRYINNIKKDIKLSWQNSAL